MQQKRKRKEGNEAEEHVPPGLEQEEFDYEQQELAAVLEDNIPGKFTKVRRNESAHVPPCIEPCRRCCADGLVVSLMPNHGLQAVQIAGASGPQAHAKRPHNTEGT